MRPRVRPSLREEEEEEEEEKEGKNGNRKGWKGNILGDGPDPKRSQK